MNERLPKQLPKQLILANPRGFCAGVDRAILIVEKALAAFGRPIYVRHEVVHNKFVVDDLRDKGAIFVEELSEVPDGQTVIFSAHGVAKSVKEAAESRDLHIFDATCPLVTKVHIEVARCDKSNVEVILIGHAGHPEVEGTMGQYRNTDAGIYLVESEADVAQLQVKNPQKLHYVTQTTLSVDDTQKIIAALRQRFPNIAEPRQDDICYATQNRQDAVKVIAAQCDVVLVVGSLNSSNSNRLRELAEKAGTPAYLIDRAEEIQMEWVTDAERIGITAGASAPELLVQEVIAYLKNQLPDLVGVEELQGQEETIHFALPKALRASDDA